ncbi:unnamed protein product [Symbiodinium natans]|uniref:Major facilitator superfamily (MFS) profile domain-containing protein n=1 Tax=Symbiodinium natans TaxID=878477 RepID=A0A812JQU0_9DINO|nr:unnamed protein product [Symbiodinium natans]
MSYVKQEEGAEGRDCPQRTKMDEELLQAPTLREVLWMLAPVYGTCLLCRMMRALVYVCVPLHVLDLGGSPTEVGLLASLYGLGFMIANIPGAFLLPCLGAKYTLLLACALFLGSASISLMEDIEMLILSQFLLGLANSLAVLAQLTYISGTVPPERLGFAISIVGTLTYLALAAGPPLGSLLREAFGIRAVFFAQLACGSLAALGSVCLGNEVEWAPSTKSGVLQAKDALKEKSGRLVRVLLFACAMQFVWKGRELFFPLAGREAGISDVLLGQIVGWSFLVDMLISPLAGWLMDSYGRVRAGAVSLTLQSVGIMVLPFHSAESIITSSTLTGLGNGLGAGLLMAFGADLAPSGAGRGAFMAVYRLLFNSMDVITPLFLSILTTSASLHASELTTGAIGLLGVMWVLRCVPETLQKHVKVAKRKQVEPV